MGQSDLARSPFCVVEDIAFYAVRSGWCVIAIEQELKIISDYIALESCVTTSHAHQFQ